LATPAFNAKNSLIQQLLWSNCGKQIVPNPVRR
jgi:hypothetical protein